MYTQNRTPLSEEQLQHVAPVVFQEVPAPNTSSRYSLIKTIDVVRALGGAGWRPVWASQSRVRSDATRGYQKHIVRFQHPDFQLKNIGDTSPELVLVNSHDGLTAYKLLAGIFRLVCGNGLIVSDGTFGSVSVRHSNVAQGEIVDASFKVIEEVPRLASSIDSFRSTQLSLPERTAFAESALIAKYDELSKAPISAEQVLKPRRSADGGTDLWSTLNVTQEHLLTGGDRGRNPNTLKRTSTREVRGIGENIRLNRALWHLAESLKATKGAGGLPS